MIARTFLLALLATSPEKGGTVAIGHTLSVDGLRVTPLAIVEDSRCPAAAVCVWAGRVVVSVRLSRGRRTLVRRVTLGEPTGTPLGNLVLDAVSPRPPVRRGYHLHFSPLAPD